LSAAPIYAAAEKTICAQEEIIQMERALGPVEYLVVMFEGNEFKGEILPALDELINHGTIRVIDLAIVTKDQDGNVMTFEANELTGEVAVGLAKYDSDLTGMLSEADLMLVAEEMDNNSTAAAMLFENVWAARFAESVRNANGQMLMNVRIPHEIVETVRQALVEAGA
jgi:hypothetical protein